MTSVEFIKKEHRIIERELIELETIMEEENVNFPNLVHVFNRLKSIWDSHEDREEKLFNLWRSQGANFPIEEILFSHRELKGHKKVIGDAINSGSEFNIKVALDTDGRMLIDKLRAHILEEESRLGEI